MYDSESEFIGFFPNLVDYYLEEELVEDEDVEWVSVIDGECTDNLCFEDVSGDDCDWYDNFINDWCDEYGLCQEVYEVEEEEEEEDETLRGDDVVCSGGFCTWTITVEDICKWGEDEETPCNFVQCNGLPLQRTKIGLAKDNCCACIEFEPF